MKRYVHLFPHKFIAQLERVNEIPEGVDSIQAPKIWEQTKGRGITIAVLDTGCDSDHPCLKNRIIGGRNFTQDDDGNPYVYEDYNGHGTHVAGTIAANLSTQGVTGVAPEANLLILKVLDKHGSGQYDWIVNAICYAIHQRADIISLSLGGPADVKELHEAILEAVHNHQMLVVCAAGNEGDGIYSNDEFAYPSSYNEVISVGAVVRDRPSSLFTDLNNEVDLVAPGEKITSTYLNGSYATLSGTSMATPHVSGALALIKNLSNSAFDRKLTVPELYAQLIKRTVPLGNSPKIEGNGCLHLTKLDCAEDISSHKPLKQIVKS